MNEYNIRLYEEGDREEVSELHSQLLKNMSSDYAKWAFEENPAIEDPSVFVAEYDGDIVGARPYLVYKMAAGDTSFLALNIAHSVVHPDHQRKGLLTDMTRKSLDYFGSNGAEVCYVGFGPVAIKAYEQIGFEKFDETWHEYWRFEDPGAVVAASSNPIFKYGGSIGSPIYTRYRSLRDRMSLDNIYEVEIFDSPPIDLLYELYKSSIPSNLIHTVRDKDYLRWRYDNPDFDYKYYILTTERGDNIAVITATGYRGLVGAEATHIMDILPLNYRKSKEKLRKIIGAMILADKNTDVYRFPGSIAKDTDLSSLGFFSTGKLPLSRIFPKEKQEAVYSLSSQDYINGINMKKFSNWLRAPCDHHRW